MCKAELGQDRENLNLWICYARLERQRGNAQSARTVYSAALSSPVAKTSSNETLELWAEWALMELELGEDRYRDVLLRHVDGGPTGQFEWSELELI